MNIHLSNEFAAVSIGIDHSANGPRLIIEDQRTGKIAYFDPIELEGLVWAEKDELLRFIDPSVRFK